MWYVNSNIFLPIVHLIHFVKNENKPEVMNSLRTCSLVRTALRVMTSDATPPRAKMTLLAMKGDDEIRPSLGKCFIVVSSI